MIKHKRIGLGVLVAVVLLLALTVPALAKKPYHYHITYDLPYVDWDNKFAEGTFTLQTENKFRSGVATLTFTNSTAMRKGTMLFTNVGPEVGSFAVKFTLPVARDDGNCSTVSFTIIEATGEYTDYGGNGTFTMCRVDENHVDGTLDGWVK